MRVSPRPRSEAAPGEPPQPDTGEAPAGLAASRAAATAALLGLVLLSALFAVWAWQFGGWFGTALYPGTVVLAAGLILLALFAPLRAGLRAWPRVALVALLGLGAWAALSALWSPSPDVAVRDGQRIFTYAMAFVLGIWLADLLRSRRYLVMVPLAFAGAFAGAQTVISILTAEEVGIFVSSMPVSQGSGERIIEGILQHPLGYHNANAAFFLIAVWPAVGLAATRELPWWLRGAFLATATLCIELGMLSQSRGSIIAAAAALAVYLIASRERARAVAWLALAAIPALVAIPALTDLYRTAADAGQAATLNDLKAAMNAAAIGAGIAAVLGAVAAFAGGRMQASERRARIADRAVVAAAVGLVVAGLAAFVVTTGDPFEWFGDRWEEFRTEGTPDTAGEATRLTFNAGSERDDQWRVALEDGTDDPLLGNGAGAFYYSYLLGRSEDGVPNARDAHSVELEFFGELGVPGLLLFSVVMVAAAGGALRARRTGPGAAAISACALTAGGYWLAHSSIDWFWSFPALTAPVLALLGSAAAPAVIGNVPRTGGRARLIGAGLAAVLALSVIAPYLSDRYTSQALANWREDPPRAYEDLDRAARLNPLAEEPLLAEAAIARADGDRGRAIDALERAVEKRPEEWVSYYFLAKLYAEDNPRQARAQFELAEARNPLGPLVERLGRQLDRMRER